MLQYDAGRIVGTFAGTIIDNTGYGSQVSGEINFIRVTFRLPGGRATYRGGVDSAVKRC